MESCNGAKFNIKSELTTTPSYLREFFVCEDKIVLVYDQKEHMAESSSISSDDKKNDSNITNDLTGNPLEVDLGGDESFVSCAKSVKPNHWSVEESNHFPLSLKAARSYMNEQNKLKSCEGGKQYPIYAVCDGSDFLHTVLLGAQKHKGMIMTTLTNIVGCYAKDHETLSLEAMEKDHIKNTRFKTPKIDFLVKFKYYLYGNALPLFENLIHLEYQGNVSVEITCNKCVLDTPQNPSDMKMVVQVIAGHNLSPIYFLWQELNLLQTYLDILSDSERCNDEFTVICNEPIDESDIYDSINEICTINLLKREPKMKFNLEHIRQEQLLDKLWRVLKGCKNLSVLRDSLHYFFEELVEVRTNCKIPENDKTNIALIVNGLLVGKLAVPTLSFSQALECLFELGAEKLKNDYQVIMKNFYSSSEQAISFKWSKFQAEELTSQTNLRKTRMTINLKSGVVDLKHNIFKLAYLHKLHIAAELILLIKDQVHLPEETFYSFCDRTYKRYVDMDVVPHDFRDLLNSPIYEFTVALNSVDVSIIERQIPVTWTMQMISKVGKMEVTTTYHLSDHPIFPTVVYNDYDVSNIIGEDKMVYYVSKMIRHREFL